MNFYIDPAFYVFLAVAIVPAAILGFSGRRIKYYGLAASLAFCSCSLARIWRACLLSFAFIAIACAVTFWELSSWRSGAKGALEVPAGTRGCYCPSSRLQDRCRIRSEPHGISGISYITFKAIQVIIEIRDDLIEDMNFTDYLYFLVFFTPFTSGPIDRSRRFTEDANRRYTASEYAELAGPGHYAAFGGSSVSESAGHGVPPLFHPCSFGRRALVARAGRPGERCLYVRLLPVLRFCGYSLMAMGASYCFGIKTPRNFRAPFLALDVRDFWDRWHMTLSTMAARFRVHARG